MSNVSMVLVGDGADAADDWIAERIGATDVCVTSDVPLASRCLSWHLDASKERGTRRLSDWVLHNALIEQPAQSPCSRQATPSREPPDRLAVSSGSYQSL